MISRLVAAGAEPDPRDQNGMTPLLNVARYIRDPLVVETLLAVGADPDLRDQDGLTSLHNVVRYTGHQGSAEALVAGDADVQARDSDGLTALDHAVLERRTIPVIRALLLAGAEPGRAGAQTDNDGHTPLHHAAMSRDSTVIGVLLRAGASANVRDAGGNTPLHHAAMSNPQPGVIRALVAAGADRWATNNDNSRPVDLLEANEGMRSATLDHRRQLHRAISPVAVTGRAEVGWVFRDCANCPEMIVVPEGRFTMGSPSREEGRDEDEGPQRTVNIRSPLAVGVYEVTFREWDACVEAGGCGGYRPGNAGWGRGNRPVIYVSWEDAQGYVRWLSRETGQPYRLLSEAEWEYVARAGTQTARYWGEEETRQCRHGNGFDQDGARSDRGRDLMAQYDWLQPVSCSDGYEGTAPVGSYPANAFGLHDVLGNVWEWTQDCWNDSYSGAPTDGTAWLRGDCSRRVLRGGSWYDLPGGLRSANRSRNQTGNRNSNIGFRVARTIN